MKCTREVGLLVRNKTMRLWVDDIRNAPEESWIVARTIGSAFNALVYMGDFEVISLDYDISHQVNIGTGLDRPFPCEENFLPVAHYAGLDHCARKFILHTANPLGAKAMKEALMRYGYEEKDIEIKPMGAANRLELEA